MEVGFIRLGHVGAPMALNLLKAGQRLPSTIARLMRTAGIDPDRFLNILTRWTSLHAAQDWRSGEQKGDPILRYVDTSQGIVGHLDGILALAGRSVDL